jgi:hypothetical protein
MLALFFLFLTSRKNKNVFSFLEHMGFRHLHLGAFGLFLLNDFSQTLLLPAQGGSQRSKK